MVFLATTGYVMHVYQLEARLYQLFGAQPFPYMAQQSQRLLMYNLLGLKPPEAAS